MKECRCKNCAANEFELVGTYLKCSYCGSWYITEFNTEQDFQLALESLGCTVERTKENIISVKHKKYDNVWYTFNFWSYDVYYSICAEINFAAGVLKYG